jgi:nucleotide-binding universal stress UspA family protein
MQNILLPIDFSELSQHAYHIASHIAKATGARITALSVIPGPQGAIYGDKGELIQDEGNDYSEWTKKLEVSKAQMKEWASDKPEVLDYVSTVGNIDTSILAYSKSIDADLIVMGTEGLFKKSIWSKASHAEFVSNHASTPLLTLKCDRENINLDKIVLLSDFLEREVVNLSVLKDIQKAFSSTLVLLKINTPNRSRSDEEIKRDMQEFARINQLEKYTMEMFSDATVEGGLGKFCAENDLDLIALGSHQGYGFSKLFKGSISDDIVNHLYHPILTFPLEK